MSRQSNSEPSPFVFGADYRSCSLTIRDRLFVEDPEVPDFLGGLQKVGITEALIMSTCDRIEVIGLHEDPGEISSAIMESFAFHGQLNISELRGKIYHKFNGAAVKHIFSMASSLESQMIGEAQVLGQMKACHRLARDLDMISGSLEKLLQNAYRVAKRVRTETGIGEFSVSSVSIAIQLAKSLFGDLGQASVILIGTGNIGEIFAKDFQRNGIKYIANFHPNERRAQALAEELGCNSIGQEQLNSALINSDIIICAMGSSQHILTSDIIRATLKKRRNKPVFVLDLGVPGDVEPSVARISDAFVYDTTDLENLVHEGRQKRETEAEKARVIVDQEVKNYYDDQFQRGAIETIRVLKGHFEEMRTQVLTEHNDAGRATELLINRLLDVPIRNLRKHASKNKFGSNDLEYFVNFLFGINETNKLSRQKQRKRKCPSKKV